MESIETLMEEAATLAGWYRVPDSEFWKHPAYEVTYHHPAGSLGAIAAMWPEGWVWMRMREWRACRQECSCPLWLENVSRLSKSIVVVPDTGSEFDDRLNLTLKVLKAEANLRERAGKE